MRVKLMFAWYDFWIGIFYDRKKKIVYIFPLPMIGIKIELNQKQEPNWKIRERRHSDGCSAFESELNAKETELINLNHKSRDRQETNRR